LVPNASASILNRYENSRRYVCRRTALLALVAACGPAFAAGAAHEAAAAPVAAIEEIEVVGERAGPQLWKVSKGDHVLWLFGTLDPLPKKMTWRSGAVESALAQSQQVLLAAPAVSAGSGPITAIRLYLQWRRTEKNPEHSHLRDWLPPPLYARFSVQKVKFDPRDGGIEELRPTFAALRLYQHAIDASGLTSRNDIQDLVVGLARRRRIPVQKVSLKIEDPVGLLKEVGQLPPSAEVSCLETTIARLETDLPSMQARARAWAVGDVERLRQLPYPNQREACLGALSASPRIKAIIARAAEGWQAAAEEALAKNRTTLAMRPIYELLGPEGALAAFRAAGYSIEGP